MRFGTITILIFMIVAIVATIGGTYYSYKQDLNIIQDELQKHLETAAQSRANHIETFIEEQIDKVKIVSSSEEIREALEKIKEEDLDDLEYELKRVLENSDEFYSILILDEKGELLVSTSIFEQRGDDFSDNIFYKDSLEDLSWGDVHYDEDFNVDSMDISTPIIEGSDFLGVLVVKVNISDLNDIVLDRTGLRRTGEIYLIDSDKYMITPSRFLSSEDTFLRLKVDTLNSMHCFENHSQEDHSEMNIFEDYRGVLVLGTHYYIERTGWCLLAEIDEAEVIGEMRTKLIRTAIFTGLFILFFVVIVGFFVSREMTRPLKRLTQEVNEISKGKLDVNLSKSNIKEVNDLTNSLIRILASLKLAILRTKVSKTDLGLGKKVLKKKELEGKQIKNKKVKKVDNKSLKAIVERAANSAKSAITKPSLKSNNVDIAKKSNLKKPISKKRETFKN